MRPAGRCHHCGASLAHMRADALWCGDACRKAAQRSGRPDKGRTRRPSRNGRGVRVYLTPEDFAPSGELRVHDLAVARKLDRAFERLVRGAA